MAFKKLSELTAKGPPCTIKVKVIRLWDSINNRTDELISLDMILIDEKGDVIHATIGKNLIDTYRPHIRESSIYSFSNFRVQQSFKYRPVSNDLKIVFIYNTKVKEVKESSKKFKENYFEFASNDTLIQRENEDKQCSDVIGLLTTISPLQQRTIMKDTNNPRTKDIREIELLLMEGKKAKITLWGELAHYLSENVIGERTVVIVTATIVQSLKFKAISLKTTSATRLYTDLNVPETWKLIASFEKEETVPKMMEVNKSTNGTLEEQMFYNRRTLQDITQIRHDDEEDQDFLFTAIVTIDQLQENTKWWYMSCNSCNKMCTKRDDRYYCNYCDEYPKRPTPRYWIRLQISDYTTTTTCTIFDEEAQRMLSTSISDLLESLQGNNEDVPKIIQQLFGKTFIFRFKLNHQNLIEGKAGYLVKRTFIPDDKLEQNYFDQLEKELMEHDVDYSSNQQTSKHNTPFLDQIEQELTELEQKESESKKPRHRAFIIESESDEDYKETSMQKETVEVESSSVCSDKKYKKKSPEVISLEKTLKTRTRVANKIGTKKQEHVVTEDTEVIIDDPKSSKQKRHRKYNQGNINSKSNQMGKAISINQGTANPEEIDDESNLINNETCEGSNQKIALKANRKKLKRGGKQVEKESIEAPLENAKSNEPENPKKKNYYVITDETCERSNIKPALKSKKRKLNCGVVKKQNVEAMVENEKSSEADSPTLQDYYDDTEVMTSIPKLDEGCSQGSNMPKYKEEHPARLKSTRNRKMPARYNAYN